MVTHKVTLFAIATEEVDEIILSSYIMMNMSQISSQVSYVSHTHLFWREETCLIGLVLVFDSGWVIFTVWMICVYDIMSVCQDDTEAV